MIKLGPSEKVTSEQRLKGVEEIYVEGEFWTEETPDIKLEREACLKCSVST